MKQYKAYSFAKCYEQIINDLVNNPEFICKPRDQKIHEMLNVAIEVENPSWCLFSNKYRSSPIKYITHELLLYFSGTNSGEKFIEASKFWKHILNDDNSVNSAYGHLIFNKQNTKDIQTQWEWAVNSLKKDKDSRQAILHYNTPDHQSNSIKDFVCTLSNQFFIRNNKLYFSYIFRSQDVHFGLPIDFVWGYFLMEMMRLELLENYPNLTLGSYYHYCASLHLYERNFEQYKNSLSYDFQSQQFPITINTNLINHKNDCINIIENKSYSGNDELLQYLTNKAFK